MRLTGSRSRQNDGNHWLGWLRRHRDAPHLRLLDCFEYSADGHQHGLGPSAERLVSLLAVQRKSVSRSKIATVLWPDASTERASANLRSALWRLQRLCPELVDSTADRLKLADEVSVDYWAGLELIDNLMDEDLEVANAERIGAAARRLLVHDLLPDHTEDAWLATERDRFRHSRLDALETLSYLFSKQGRPGLAVELGLAAVHADPYRESAHRALIDAHLAQGNQREATLQFEACCRLLIDELGIAPSTMLTDMFAGMLTSQIA
jgi:DNA-binding SARP family transcriptional activator